MTAPGAGTRDFTQGAAAALADPAMQAKLRDILGYLREGRLRQIPRTPPAEEIRERGRLIRAEVLAHLDEYLEQFVERARANGMHVHVTRTAEEARQIVLDVCRRHGVRRVSKGKSMVSEELGLREALEAEGLDVTETDIGELLCQLAAEPPSHLIAPAVHMKLDRMAEVLGAAVEAGDALPADPEALLAAARRYLRRRMLAADLGITGANFGIAETGTFCVVTNEGNGDLSATVPPVHVALLGIERLVPTLESAATILQLLTRSATGQHISVYVSFFGGPAPADSIDGPREQHLVLVDAGRARLIGTEYEEALACIRCGACLNACPVYERSGGHAYRSVYAGPIGAVVTPLYGDSPIARELPHASTLCGACRDICPVKIDIPRMLVALRRDHPFEGAGEPGRAARALVSWGLASPVLYWLGTRLARLVLRRRSREGWIRRGPGPLARWTAHRDLRAPDPRPFRRRWRSLRAARRRGRR